MKKTFYDKTDIGASRKLIDDATEINIKEGTVISVSTSEVRVQLEGTRFQSAYAAKGITVEQNDRVLLVRSPRTTRWIVIGAYVNPQSAGNVTGSTTNALAPSGLTAVPILGGFLARCTVGVDTPAVLEFEVADDTAETNAVHLLMAGSTLPYVASAAKLVRVRSVDTHWNRSGWTDWITATPITKVALASGGTNADLSGTGPGFLKQATLGANVTVAAIAQADLPVFTGDSGSGGVKGAVPAPATGDAAANKFLKASGSWSTLPASGHTIQDNGTNKTQRSKLNFIGATVADNAGADSTDVTITSSGAVTATKKTLQTRTVLYDSTLGADAASFDVSSIDQTYDHLEVEITGKISDNSYGAQAIYFQFNGDTTNANYVSSRNETATNVVEARGGIISNWNSWSGMSGSHVIIPWYRDTTTYRALTSLWNLESRSTATGDLSLEHWAETWKNTAAINRIVVTPATGGKNFKTGTRMIIIGIKQEDVVIDVSGAVRAGRTTTATNYTMLTSDIIVAVTNTAAARTITLPPASGAVIGLPYWVKDESGGAGTNNITVQKAGSDTVDGGTSVIISVNYGKVVLYSDGVSKWFTI